MTVPTNPWQGLASLGRPSPGAISALESGVSVGEGEVLYAIDSEGSRHLLIPVASSTLVSPDQRSRGVHLSGRRLEREAQSLLFVDLECRKPHLNGVFQHLIDEILVQLAPSVPSPELVARTVLSRWRELLDREITNVLSKHAIVGLYGELWHLRELAGESVAAVEVWTGPSGAPHDFRRGDLALEVKTTLAADAWRFAINGIDQLDVPSGGTLLLGAMSIDAESAGESLPELVDSILALGVDSFELYSRLATAGYREADQEYYRELQLSVRECRTYRVDSDFPRLVRHSFTSGDLPARVQQLSYVIELGGEPPHPLSDQEARAFYSAIAYP